MQTQSFVYMPERAEDGPAVDALNELAFGPGRFAKTAYRLREGVPPEPSLCFVARAEGTLIGSVRLTRVGLADRAAVLLGPLAVAPSHAGRGAGRELVRIAVDAAKSEGYDLVLLVGDHAYYGPLGFSPLPGRTVALPGPADPNRILFAELRPGALAGLAGVVTRATGE